MSDDRPPHATLNQFVAGLKYDHLPETAVETVERCFVDTLGVTLAGATAAAGAKAAASITSLATAVCDGASIVGRGESLTVRDAALVNATAAHALDFDDVAGPMNTHPSAPMVAPLIAVGEVTGASGRDLLTAYVAGFEAQYYLSVPIEPAHYEIGWHSTATVGTFGATAAVANLLNLSAAEVARALNIAASMPAGLKRNFGSATKAIHAGQAARSGVTAAQLAAEGFTADADAIAGDGGFFDLYTGTATPDTSAMPTLEDDLGILSGGVHRKKYPSCYFTQASIAATAALRDEHDLTPADVVSISVTYSPGADDALAHDDPTTDLEAKFSIQYTVASALVHGTYGLGAFDDEAVRRVCPRVSAAVDKRLDYSSLAATVTIETDEGERHITHLDRPPGTEDNPLSCEELREKFLRCSERTLGEESAADALDEVKSLRSCKDVGTLSLLDEAQALDP